MTDSRYQPLGRLGRLRRRTAYGRKELEKDRAEKMQKVKERLRKMKKLIVAATDAREKELGAATRAQVAAKLSWTCRAFLP